MYWRKKLAPQSVFRQGVGVRILLVLLLGLISFGTFSGAEDLTNKSSKPAMVANLEFVNADLHQVFRYLAGAGGFQTLLDPGVQGVVSIAFNAKIPAKDAATVLATSSGFSFRWLGDGTTLFIGNSNPGDSSLQARENRVLTLKYLNPAVAVEALTAAVAKARITTGASKNQLTIVANELEWRNITEIIQDLDRTLPQLTIETRIVELPETFFKDLDRNSFPSPTRMGAFPLTSGDLGLMVMESHSQYSALYRREIPVSESQPGILTLEDQIPKVQENSQEGSVNYQIENLAVGNNLGVTLHPGQGTKLNLWIRSKVGTITNTNPPIDASGYVPALGVRELTSIIPWEPGQKILLTGALQRGEFNRLLNIPYKFPVLQELFLGKNIVQPAQNTPTQVVIIMIPLLKGGADANTVTPSPSRREPGSESAGSDLAKLPGATEEKETLQLGPGSPRKGLTPTPTSRRGSTSPTGREEITRIHYVVKQGDTLTRIAAKFGITVGVVIGENNLDVSGTIKVGITLSIPVNSNRIYTIKPKDTLWRIAKRYGITVEELKDLNGLADIEKVEAGQQIVLPVPVDQIKNPQF